MPNLWLVFITGLFTGGITCLAVQGGLLTATLVRLEEEHPEQSRAGSILAFVTAKLVAYTILGALLGWLGSFFQFSLRLQAILIALAGIFMIGTALALLDVHPIFRYFVIQPPRFLTRLVRKISKSQSWLTPAMVGALTIFIPCGTTQAMMALAVGSGKPALGALILFSFILGTSPLFFLLGYSIDLLKDTLKQNFAKVAATVVIFLAVWNLNSAVVLSGSRVSLQTIWRGIKCTISFCSDTELLGTKTATTTPTVTFMANQYVVDNPVLPAGQPISLTLTNLKGAGCIQSFTVPELGLQEFVPLGQTKTLAFNAPTQPGDLTFSCGMGMYTGRFIVK